MVVARVTAAALCVAALAIPSQPRPVQAAPAALSASRLEFGLSNGPSSLSWMTGSGVPWMYRYTYLSGGVNTTHGWETWNSPPGAYATFYMDASYTNGYIPVFPYYELLQSSPSTGSNESDRDYSNLNNAATMAAYYANFKLLMQKAGAFGHPVVVQVEPDLWGYLEQRAGSGDASTLATSVASSGFSDVSSIPNTAQGFAEALLHIRDLYAGNAMLAIHASLWASGIDIGSDTSVSVDAVAVADRTAAFLNSAGIASNPYGSTWDLVFNDVDDHDAAWWEAQGANSSSFTHWWDPTNVAFPNFTRYLAWVSELHAKTGRQQVAWQVPEGNQYYLTMNNTNGHYQDTIAQYFIGHPQALLNAGLVAVLFGAGNQYQTNNEDVMNDGVTNNGGVPTTDLAGFCNACNTHASTTSDDDGGYLRTFVGQYYASVAFPGAPTNVIATATDQGANVSWTAPSSGASSIISYVVTAYDGCTIQGSATVTGAPPATSLLFSGLTNGTAYTFKVAAVNANGSGPQSAASNAVVPTGIAPAWVTACSASQYHLASSDGTAWTDMDTANLGVSFTPAVASYAIITANADLWTSSPGYNQDLGVALSGAGFPLAAGQPEAWKESGGFAGTFSPNAATLQTIIQVGPGITYGAKLQWKANRADPGTIYAGAGPIGGAYSPTRLTVQLIPISANTVFIKQIKTQSRLTGSDGATWQDVDLNLSVRFVPPTGSWLAYISGNADLFTSAAGYNQDIGVSMAGAPFPSSPGQPEAWKESGGSAGVYSPNAAFVQAPVFVSGGQPYQAKLQWKANRPDPGTIWAGAGPIGGSYSPTTLTVILVPATSSTTHSTQQYSVANSDGSSQQSMDLSKLRLTLAPSVNTSYVLSANADLWTSIAGYNQDLGLMVSGGAYGTGTLVAWKESGGFAGTFSPNAAFVTTNLHLQAGQSYTVWVVWKSNRPPSSGSDIFAGAGPIGSAYSPTWLTAQLLS